MERFLVTGGAGFIGSALVRALVAQRRKVLVIDKLTYAADMGALSGVVGKPGFELRVFDIADAKKVAAAVEACRPDVIMHLAAETHVDRSIDDPHPFIMTNVVGTHVMLEAATKYFHGLSGDDKRDFRFVQVSTDEVYGSCDGTASFCETSPHAPNSPYSASKAAGDHFARAWFHTFGLPTIVTHCSNNYGPYQHPEKFIPTVVRHALAGKPIPIYGTGENRRDWIHVDDHVAGLLAAARRGVPGERYNLGANEEMANLALAHTICAQLDELRPRNDGAPHASLIAFVTDRPGHDLRYAIDSSRAVDALGWRPSRTFREGIAETVKWYLSNPDWLANARGELGRLGLSGRA